MKYTKELSIFTGYIDNLKTEVHSTQAIGDCPYCGKEDKFYYNKYKNLWDCKSCGEYGHTEKLAQFLEITHLFEDIDVHELPLEKVEVISLNGTDEDDSDDEEQNSEIRDFYKTFRNIEVGDKYYDYLRGRGYSHEYIMLNIDNFFKEKEEYKFKDYLIIPVRHKYKIYGFLGRIIWSKEKLKEHDQKINVRFL